MFYINVINFVIYYLSFVIIYNRTSLDGKISHVLR